MNIFAAFGIVIVVGGMIALVYYLPQQEIDTHEDEVRQLITQFTKSGEYIGFDQDPLPPITRYVYETTGKLIETVLENGTTVKIPETILVPADESTPENKQFSTLDVNIQDRVQSGTKICKIGYQCDLTGTIVLIDPKTNKKIPPPYGYLIMIDCDYRDFCTLTTLSSNEATFPDGTFKYTWVPTDPVTPGEYVVSVFTTSHFTNEDGEQERRFAERRIQVVE